jgi:hypothetical protein
MRCNDGEIILPADKSTRVLVKKVLHNTLCVRGRAPRVILVTPPTSPQNTIIPVAQSVSLGAPRRSMRLKAKKIQRQYRECQPWTKVSWFIMVCVLSCCYFLLVLTLSYAASGRRSGIKTTGVPVSQTRPKYDNEKPAALIAIPQNDDIQYINQDIFSGPSVNGKDSSLLLSDAVVKFSWVSRVDSHSEH